jgi:hypothetical protein
VLGAFRSKLFRRIILRIYDTLAWHVHFNQFSQSFILWNIIKSLASEILRGNKFFPHWKSALTYINFFYRNLPDGTILRSVRINTAILLFQLAFRGPNLNFFALYLSDREVSLIFSHFDSVLFLGGRSYLGVILEQLPARFEKRAALEKWVLKRLGNWWIGVGAVNLFCHIIN